MMGVSFARGFAELTRAGVIWFDMEVIVIMRIAIAGMRVVGGYMDVSPERISRDMAILEGVGHAMIIYISLHAFATIYSEMGQLLQPLNAPPKVWDDSRVLTFVSARMP